MTNIKQYQFDQTSLENLMKGIRPYGDYSASETLNELKNTFNTVLQEAVAANSKYVEYADYNDYIAVSSLDIERVNRNKIITVDGGVGIDTLLVDHYIVKDTQSITVNKKNFINRNGKKVDGYSIKIRDEFGNNRTYNVSNIEKLRFVDSNNKMQEVDLKRLSVLDTPKIFVGLGEKATFGATDDTVDVHALGSGSNIDHLDGGGGNDTIQFVDLDEANIDSITYDDKTKYYTMITADGGSVKFRNFETLKLKNNTYKIQRPSNNPNDKNMLTLEQRFIYGNVFFSDLDSAQLSKGVYFGSIDDRVLVRSLAALTGDKSKPASFSGGSGVDTLDLSPLPNVKLKGYTYDSLTGEYRLEINIGTAKRTIKVENFEKLKLSKNETVEINEESLNSFLTTNAPVSFKENIISPKNTDWLAAYSGFDGENTISGSHGKIDVLSLDGDVEDYVFSYEAGDVSRGIPDTIQVKRLPDNSVIYLDNIDAVKFSNGQRYRLLDNANNPFGDFDLTQSQYGNTYISYIYLANQIDNSLFGYNTANVYYGTDLNESLLAGVGNDTFFFSGGEDYINGGDGIDTLILEDIYTYYDIEKSNTGYVIKDIYNNFSTINNIEYVVYYDKDLNSHKVKIEDFYSIIKNIT